MSEIIIALDVSSGEKAHQVVDTLGEKACWYKVGLELFLRDGVSALKMLKKKGKKVFLDLKFHDIPNTVSRAVESSADMGVDMINVHVLGGAEMMESAASVLVNRKNPPLLVGVTILTSMDTTSLKKLGIKRSPRGWVGELALLAQECGLDGVVASGKEIKRIRSLCGQNFKIVTPGIRFSDGNSNDQKRIVTPKQASKWGADFLVMGRPILSAKNPRQAYERAIRELI